MAVHCYGSEACSDMRFHWWSQWFHCFHDPCGQCEGGGAIVWGNAVGGLVQWELLVTMKVLPCHSPEIG
jgi:hypothetical protein